MNWRVVTPSDFSFLYSHKIALTSELPTLPRLVTELLLLAILQNWHYRLQHNSKVVSWKYKGLMYCLVTYSSSKIITKKKDSNVLYSVILQCKVYEGKEDAYVRDVKAATEAQCVMFCERQLSDLNCFFTDPREYSVLTADTTYNLGDFLCHTDNLSASDVTTGRHPTFMGPILIHQRKIFSAF